MRKAKRPAGLVLGVALAVLPGAGRGWAAGPNVLLVTIDTLRPDRLSCYSTRYLRTPAIDALASRGVLFERAFAHNPETLPSHANILLGLTSLAHGVSENSKSVVAPDFLALPELLKSRGYATGAFVGAFTLDSRFGLAQGFDVYDDHYPAKPAAGDLIPERRAGATITAALKWLSGAKGPWFCWIHLWDPHEPYQAPEPFLTQYRDDPYSGEVAYADSELARLFGELDRRGLSGQTLIILTADHGESLGEHGELYHGYFAYNSTLWVPLIIASPGIKAARVTDLVSHVDIFPTVCELAGAKKPPALQGESLVPLLRGRPRRPRPIYFEALEAYLNRGWAPLRGIIADGRKYMDSPIPELYDLGADFDEARNLAPSADLEPLRKELRELMDRNASPLAAKGLRPTTDRETLERLRSLGYVAAQVTQLKSSYGPEDDLKTLFPLEFMVGYADFLARGARPAEGIRLLEEVIQKRPDFVKAYDRLFGIYRSQGRIEEALAVYERGYAANPGDYGILSGYGLALVLNGRYQKGAELLEKSLALYDQDPRIWNSLGVAYGKLGDLEKAREDLSRALALAPDDAGLNENVGAFYLAAAFKTKDAGSARQALNFFSKAVEADPTLASAFNGLGGALRLLDRTDEAVASWEKAVALDPGFTMAIYNLALAYLEKGDKGKAREYCEKYLQARGRNITPEEEREIAAIMERAKKQLDEEISLKPGSAYLRGVSAASAR
jgi:arylsulfatase A-like enzyme/Flp pilus assembly protein TadD